MIVKFPTPPLTWNATWMAEFLAAMQRYFQQIVANTQETPRVILRSPNGSNFDVTVSDAGALVVTPTAKTRA